MKRRTITWNDVAQSYHRIVSINSVKRPSANYRRLLIHHTNNVLTFDFSFGTYCKNHELYSWSYAKEKIPNMQNIHALLIWSWGFNIIYKDYKIKCPMVFDLTWHGAHNSPNSHHCFNQWGRLPLIWLRRLAHNIHFLDSLGVWWVHAWTKAC